MLQIEKQEKPKTYQHRYMLSPRVGGYSVSKGHLPRGGNLMDVTSDTLPMLSHATGRGNVWGNGGLGQ
jgi:hypothetical protein